MLFVHAPNVNTDLSKSVFCCALIHMLMILHLRKYILLVIFLTYSISNCPFSWAFASPHLLHWRQNACLHRLPQCEYLKENTWINQCPTTDVLISSQSLWQTTGLSPKSLWFGYIILDWYSNTLYCAEILAYTQYMLSLVFGKQWH